MQKGRPSKRKVAKSNLSTVYIIFALIALFSAIGLDYFGWRKGEKSYVFSTFMKKKRALLSQENPDQIVLSRLSSLRIGSESIQQYRDQEGTQHIMIDLPLKKYDQLESSLEEEFKKAKASILEREEQKGEAQNYYLWHVTGKRKQRLTLLFSCQKAQLEKKKAPYREPAKNKVVIIVDDMGYSLKAIKDICSIKKPLTISVLPFTPLARETARIAHQNNLEVMLHLPLESINNKEGNNDIEGIIHSKMSQEEIIETMENSIEQVPYINGVNNHMGSKITANVTFMRVILTRLKEENLYFVDSRTTANSIAYRLAQKMGIPSSFRHVFLDTYNNEDYIRGKLFELFRLAQKNGKAVGICHPSEETLKVLKENFHRAKEFDLEPVFASQIVQ